MLNFGASKPKVKGGPPGSEPNSFNFMHVLRKFGNIVCWHPPGRLAPPPWGNPGSATEKSGF